MRGVRAWRLHEAFRQDEQPRSSFCEREMGVKSMTGFSRTAGVSSPYRWIWELKALNAKGLDLRTRMPPGFDSLEPEVRVRLAKRLARGACYVNLSMQRDAPASDVRVNREAIEAILAAVANIRDRDALGPVSLDGLLAVRGVVDVIEGEDEDRARHESALMAGLEQAIDDLTQMRRREGQTLAEILQKRLQRLAELVREADAAPGRKPEAVRARLVRLIAELSAHSSALDPARLHQEALLLAAKADVTEEIDRLRAHVAAAEALLQAQGPVGRRLDFLSQELAREANTLCAKSNDASLTTIGVEMRVEIEQFREQVQNIE